MPHDRRLPVPASPIDGDDVLGRTGSAISGRMSDAPTESSVPLGASASTGPGSCSAMRMPSASGSTTSPWTARQMPRSGGLPPKPPPCSRRRGLGEPGEAGARGWAGSQWTMRWSRPARCWGPGWAGPGWAGRRRPASPWWWTSGRTSTAPSGRMRCARAGVLTCARERQVVCDDRITQATKLTPGERSQVEDDEIRARFDGRPRVELTPGRITAAKQRRADEIAHALGYRLSAVHSLWPAGVQLVFERDDEPQACRRRELTIARLRADGPLLTGIEPPPPPPPGPPPQAPAHPRPRRSSRPPAEPPPPPAAPARPRVPPPPPFPPPPPPPPTDPAS